MAQKEEKANGHIGSESIGAVSAAVFRKQEVVMDETGLKQQCRETTR